MKKNLVMKIYVLNKQLYTPNLDTNTMFMESIHRRQ